jgi:hypothetical protein
MSKKEIAKIPVTVHEAKRQRQYNDIYSSDISSGTADLFDHKDYIYIMENKRSQLKEGDIPNPVGYISFKTYYNSVIKLLNYQMHEKKRAVLADMTT